MGRMIKACADFETTDVDSDSVRVWHACIVELDTFETLLICTDIDQFMDWLSTRNSKLWFHNLKFDGYFILSWLLKNGFEHNDSKQSHTFRTLISATGVFYSITVYFKTMKKRYLKVTFQDSYKKLPFKAAVVAEAFNLDMRKLSIDYDKPRPVGYVPTADEDEYIKTDCMIIAQALSIQIENGLKGMTIGADALNMYKKTCKYYDKWFPLLPLELDFFIRQSYKGGYVYLKPEYAGVEMGKVMSLDVNSLYPHVMRNYPLPYGYPIEFTGKYQPDAFFPLYVQHVCVMLRLKDGCLPTIQIKNNRFFSDTEYLHTTGDEIVDLYLTNVDMQLMFNAYEIRYIEYIDGIMFKAGRGMFDEFIDHWYHVKQTTEGAKKTIAKLLLNNLYGKFAKNPIQQQSVPVLVNDVVRFIVTDSEECDPVYVAVATFITAWSRHITINACQSNYERFIYTDTDSIHLTGHAAPDNLNVHKDRLGAWKIEDHYIKAKFLRAKSYIEITKTKNIIKCSGMTDECKKLVNINNFNIGESFKGKLQARRVRGGVRLVETDFTIQS